MPLFEKSGILRIQDMYNLQLGVLMYKFTRQELSRSLMSLYEYSTTPHDTRHGQDPISPKYTTNLVRRTFLYRGPNMWRKLADAVTKIPGSLRAFKNVLTRHLHAQCRRYNYQKHSIVVSWVRGGFFWVMDIYFQSFLWHGYLSLVYF